MDRLSDRIAIAEHAVETLHEVATIDHPSAAERDAALIRFEWAFEETWRAARRLLGTVFDDWEVLPKAAIRELREAGVLTAAEADRVVAMAEDALLAAHANRALLADWLFARLRDHEALLHRWLHALRERVGPG